jgi:hypothetical protein
MSYPIISKEDGTKLLSAHRNKADAYLPARYSANEGQGDSEVAGVNFTQLHKELKQLLVGPVPKGEKRDAFFEMKACSVVHQSLAGLSAAAASDPRFWIWLTFAVCNREFLHLVELRMPSKGGNPPAEANYGITSRANIHEGLYARLWWRGYRFFDSRQTNPYELAERGDIDFWRSHIIRQSFSYSDSMAHAFIRFMLPQHGVASGLDTAYVRAVAKKLKARHASCVFEALTEDECLSILQDIAASVVDVSDSDGEEAESSSSNKKRR